MSPNTIEESARRSSTPSMPERIGAILKLYPCSLRRRVSEGTRSGRRRRGGGDGRGGSRQVHLSWDAGSAGAACSDTDQAYRPKVFGHGREYPDAENLDRYDGHRQGYLTGRRGSSSDRYRDSA